MASQALGVRNLLRGHLLRKLITPLGQIGGLLEPIGSLSSVFLFPLLSGKVLDAEVELRFGVVCICRDLQSLGSARLCTIACRAILSLATHSVFW